MLHKLNTFNLNMLFDFFKVTSVTLCLLRLAVVRLLKLNAIQT